MPFCNKRVGEASCFFLDYPDNFGKVVQEMQNQVQIRPPEYALAVLERLADMGYEAYVVGGCVRDSLLGKEPKDWDVCTNATPKEVLACFRRFHVIKTGLKHGTVTVMADGEPVEVTTFRIDGEYTDNRHPDSVSFVTDVRDDLARRDFTVNAMAYCPRRGLVDAFGGQEDLAARLIRCVGEPDERFNEDGLRILRALRFAARYGFGIERETAYAMRRNRHLLANVSAERIFKELKGILMGAAAIDMLLAFPDIFSTIIPELTPCIGFEQHTPHHCYDVWTHIAHSVQAAPADEVLRLTMLLHDIAKPGCFSMDAGGCGHFFAHSERGAKVVRNIMNRLKSDNATKDTVVTLVREHDHTLPSSRPGMRRWLGRLGEENARRLFDVKKADYAAQSPFRQKEKTDELRAAKFLMEEVLADAPALQIKDLAINGKTLMELGMERGPEIGKTLFRLLAEVQDETLPNERDALLQRVRQWTGGEE